MFASRVTRTLSCFVSKSPKIDPAEGVADLGHDLHVKGPAQGYPAAAEQTNCFARRRACKTPLLRRGPRHIDRCLRASFRSGEVNVLRRNRRFDRLSDGLGFNDADVVAPALRGLRQPLLCAEEAKEQESAPLENASHGFLRFRRLAGLLEDADVRHRRLLEA